MEMQAKQLPIPPRAVDDANSVEILRVWAAHGQQHVSLATGLWKDPACWGLMLVDLAKHIANAYEQTTGQDRNAVLLRLRQAFDVEWANGTDEPIGRMLD